MTTTLELIVQAQRLVKPVPKVMNEKGQPAPDSAGILQEWHRVAPLVGLSLLPGDYTIERGGVDEKGRVVPPMLDRTFVFGGGSDAHRHRTQWLLDQRESLTLSQAAALSMGLTYCLRDVLLIPCPEPIKKEYGPPKDRDTKPENERPKGRETVEVPPPKRPGQFHSGVSRAPVPAVEGPATGLPVVEAPDDLFDEKPQNNATTAPEEASSPGNGSDPPPAEGSTVVAPSQVQSEGEPSDYPGPASTPTPSEAAPVPPVVGPPSAGPFQCSRCSSVIRDDEIAMYDLEDDKAQEFPFCEECWETVGPLKGPDAETEAALQDAANAFLGGIGEPVKSRESATSGPSEGTSPKEGLEGQAKCDSCGKVCKDNRGLSAHKRKCQPREGPSEPQGKERDLRKNPEKGDAPKFLGITYEVLHVEGSKLQIRKVSSPGGVQSVVDEPWSLARWRAFWKKRTPDPANVSLVKESSDNVVSEGLASLQAWKEES